MDPRDSIEGASLSPDTATARRPAPDREVAPPGRWVLVGTKSRFGFRIRNMFWRSSGRFEHADGVLDVSPSGWAEVKGAVRAVTIATGIALRDRHLRSADFFDVGKYRELRFESAAVEPAGEGRFSLIGTLEIKQRRHPVSLGLERVFEADGVRLRGETTIDRRDYDVIGPFYSEWGGVALDRQVELQIDALFVPESAPN